MMRRTNLLLLIAVFTSLLAACAGQTAAPTTLPTVGAAGSSLTTEDKLGAGILRLENSDLAVTAEQAGELLVLWKAVARLSEDDITTAAEMDALYAQIEGALSDQQVQSIRALTLSDSELNSLRQQYAAPVTTADSADAQVEPGGGQPPDGGMPVERMAVAAGGEMNSMTMPPDAGTGSSAEAQPPSVTQDLNVLLAPALVELLTQRSNA